MTLRERTEAYAAAFPKQKASHLRIVQEQGRDVIYGRWVLGADYRNKSQYYGAYPPGFLPRVMALFPDIISAPFFEVQGSILHAFSGSLPASLEYSRCDVMRPDVEFPCRVEDLARFTNSFRLVIADPPYASSDAKRYGTPMINRGKATRALADVVIQGAFLCWLDTTWPMHSKTQWLTVGRITITRSTNHRVRDLTIFQRVAT